MERWKGLWKECKKNLKSYKGNPCKITCYVMFPCLDWPCPSYLASLHSWTLFLTTGSLFWQIKYFWWVDLLIWTWRSMSTLREVKRWFVVIKVAVLRNIFCFCCFSLYRVCYNNDSSGFDHVVSPFKKTITKWLFETKKTLWNYGLISWLILLLSFRCNNRSIVINSFIERLVYKKSLQHWS